MKGYIETSKLKQIIIKEVEELIGLNRHLGMIVKTAKKAKQPTSQEDVNDAIDFYIKSFKLNAIIKLYNTFIGDNQEMTEYEKENDRQCEIYRKSLESMRPKK